MELETNTQFSAPNYLFPTSFQSEPDYDPFAEHRRPTVGEKEDEYRQKRRRLVISPERVDPFADGTFPNVFNIVSFPNLNIVMNYTGELRLCEKGSRRFVRLSIKCLISVN